MARRALKRKRAGAGQEGVEAAAIGIAVDAVAAEVVGALRAGGIHCILLKGASFDRWLYSADAPRPYYDVDLLLAPSNVSKAAPVLSASGFERLPGEYQPQHSEDWVRWRDDMGVDLHQNLLGVGTTPAAAWHALAERTEPMTIGGIEVDVLDPVARAMQVALHAAQHGLREEKPLADLTRALERLPRPVWADAAALAERLEAVPAFATGLRLVPPGAELAAELDLPVDTPMEVALHAVTASRQTRFVSRVAATPGAAAKASMLGAKILPSRTFMRTWYPVARRGALGLLAAYVWRQIWLISRAGPAILAWWQARRMAR